MSEVPDYQPKDVLWPEPIWAIYLTREQLEAGDWLNIAPDEIVDYRVNPLAVGWESRYRQSAIDRLKALNLPKLALDVRDFGALPDSGENQ